MGPKPLKGNTNGTDWEKTIRMVTRDRVIWAVNKAAHGSDCIYTICLQKNSDFIIEYLGYTGAYYQWAIYIKKKRRVVKVAHT